MYDDELALTGLGGVAIGGAVFGAVWLAAIAFLAIAIGLVLLRVATRSRGPYRHAAPRTGRRGGLSWSVDFVSRA